MAKKPAASRSTSSAAAHAGAAAVHNAPASVGTISSAMDYAEHESTYHKFTGLVKWAIVITAVVVVFLYVVIHPMVQVAAS